MPKTPEAKNGADELEKVSPSLPERASETNGSEEGESSPDISKEEVTAESIHNEIASLATPAEFKKRWEDRIAAWEQECAAFIKKVGTFESLNDEVTARTAILQQKPDTYQTNEYFKTVLDKLEKINNEAAGSIQQLVDQFIEVIIEVETHINSVERKVTEQGAWPGALRGIHEAMKAQRGVQSTDELKETTAKMLEAAPEQAAMAQEVLNDPFLSVAAFRSIEQSVDRELTNTERHFAKETKPVRERIKTDPDRAQKFKQFYQAQKTKPRAPREQQAAVIPGLEDYAALDKLEHEKILAQRPLVNEKRAIDAYVQSLQGEYSKHPSWTNFAAEQFTLGMALQEPSDARYLLGNGLARSARKMAEDYQTKFNVEIEKFDWTDDRQAAARQIMREIWPALNVFVPKKASGEIGLDSRASLYLMAIVGLRPSSRETRNRKNLTCEPGEKHAGTITINSGNIEGIESPLAEGARDYIARNEKPPYWRAPREMRRLVIDHHSDASEKKYSASRYLYSMLNELGFFETPEFERAAKIKGFSKQSIEKLLTFVDEEDNKTNEFWHNQPADWWAKHAPDTMLTLGKEAHPLGLLRYFEDHELKDVTEPLTRREIQRLDRSLDPKEDPTLEQAQGKMRNAVRNATEAWAHLKDEQGAYTQYEKKGNEVIKRTRLLLKSPTHGEVILTTHGFPGSVDGVRGMAGKHAVYAIYQTGRDAFFVSTTEDSLPEGFMTTEDSNKRGMWVRGDKSQPIPPIDELLKALGINEGSLSEEQRKALADFTDTKRYSPPKQLLGLDLKKINSHKWIDALTAQIKELHATGKGEGAYSQAALDREILASNVSLEEFYKQKAKDALREGLTDYQPEQEEEPEAPKTAATATETAPPAPPERMSDEIFEQKLKEQMAIVKENLYNKYRKELEGTAFEKFREATKEAMARDYAEDSAAQLEVKVRAKRSGSGS